LKAKQTTFGDFLRNARTGSAPFGYLLVGPLVVWLLITIVVPLVYSVYMSFTDAGIIGTEAAARAADAASRAARALLRGRRELAS